jgi:cyclic pyranopterin phosphate synthase
MIADRLGREFRKLRVSLTAACNYSCSYCVPQGEKRHAAKRELTGSQLLRAVRLIKQLTRVDQLRITGGEPLLSPLFDSFVECVAEMGFEDVSLTTNGQFLEKKARHIARHGIRRINVSLDTLDPHGFRAISKAGDLFSVLAGIEQSLALGLKVKINMVPLRRYNADQILPLLEYCLDRNIELRFIELMRMGHLSNPALFQRDYLAMEYILGAISTRYAYLRAEAPFDSTAARFHIPGRGYFGIIANESEPFCSSCTRLRLSSSGHLHGCLSSTERHYIGDILEMPDELALPLMEARLQAALGNKQSLFSGGETVMRLIGG